MNTMRYNPFSFIHKALRGLLSDTAITLQQTDFTDVTEANIAIKKVEKVLEHFESHAYHEDRHIIPAIIKFDGKLAAEIESEHEKDDMLIFRLENKITKFMHASAGDEKRSVGNEIMYGFIDFVAFNLIHMNKEEQLINEVLWNNYTDQELLEINHTIRASVPQHEMMEIIRWMVKSANNPEITGLLNDAKQSAPAEVYQSVEQMVKQELPLNRWQKINEGIVEEMPL
jgi:hypothetical protein